MPIKRISAEEEEVRLVKIMDDGNVCVKNISKQIKKLEKAMRLQERIRKKHAKKVNFALKGIKAKRLAGETQVPNFRNSGRPKATKKGALL